MIISAMSEDNGRTIDVSGSALISETTNNNDPKDRNIPGDKNLHEFLNIQSDSIRTSSTLVANTPNNIIKNEKPIGVPNKSKTHLLERSAPTIRKRSEEQPSTSSNKNSEINFYLKKLKGMVPFSKSAPKLSKVELIHSAIDYITDLQESLEAKVKRIKTDDSSSSRPPFTNLTVTTQHNCDEMDNHEPPPTDFPSNNSPVGFPLQLFNDKLPKATHIHKEQNSTLKSSLIDEIDKYFEENIVDKVLFGNKIDDRLNLKHADILPKCNENTGISPGDECLVITKEIKQKEDV